MQGYGFYYSDHEGLSSNQCAALCEKTDGCYAVEYWAGIGACLQCSSNPKIQILAKTGWEDYDYPPSVYKNQGKF